MEDARKLIEELKELVCREDKASSARIDEIAEWFGAHKTEENLTMFRDFLDSGLKGVENNVTRLVERVRQEKQKGS